MVAPDGFLALYVRTTEPVVVKIAHSMNPFLYAPRLRTGNDDTICLANWHPAPVQNKTNLRRLFARYWRARDWFEDVNGEIKSYFDFMQHHKQPVKESA